MWNFRPNRGNKTGSNGNGGGCMRIWQFIIQSGPKTGSGRMPGLATARGLARGMQPIHCGVALSTMKCGFAMYLVTFFGSNMWVFFSAFVIRLDGLHKVSRRFLGETIVSFVPLFECWQRWGLELRSYKRLRHWWVLFESWMSLGPKTTESFRLHSWSGMVLYVVPPGRRSPLATYSLATITCSVCVISQFGRNETKPIQPVQCSL